MAQFKYVYVEKECDCTAHYSLTRYTEQDVTQARLEGVREGMGTVALLILALVLIYWGLRREQP